LRANKYKSFVKFILFSPQKWDEELSMVAQLWADQCIFRHDCRNVGE